MLKGKWWQVPSKRWMPLDQMAWCEEQFGKEGRDWRYGIYGSDDGAFQFKTEQDAFFFSMAWAGQ